MIFKKIISNFLICFTVLVICISSVLAIVKIYALKEKEECLFGKVIYIDAGHGGKDNGASVDSVMEDNINLKISGYLLESLKK